ncbi:GerAB/ArcD/ProY family transporter [Brevibacillus migulae]|uniref:GerAB/ArcD/ProY family transporter n=1 Tax=Brevibacillus migulae TaxID=1644114 RepID=UPI00106DFEC6|nr:GerAB/ArcD/ProY family transporter [Brevibacillus migulae]
MKINVTPKESNMLPTYLVWVLICSNQIGVGILGFQRIIAEKAGHDAWISVIVAGIMAHFTMLIIVKTLKRYPSADLYGIHIDVLGKRLGKLVSLFFILYCIATAMMILRNYIEVIQTWVFPEIPTGLFAAVFLFLALYTMLGGIRVIAGYTFLTVIVVIWLLLDLYYPLQIAEWNHLLPVMEADISKIWGGAMSMSLTIIGFEIIYVLYPYIKEKKSVGASAQFGLFLTNLIYLVLMVVALVFFSEGQLAKTIWATLNLKKMVYLPFLERFEFVAIPLWLFVIMPNIMLYSWAAVRGLKRNFNWSQRKFSYVVIILMFISSLFLITRQQIETLNDIIGRVGLIGSFAYPFILYLLVVIKQAWRRKREAINDESAK